MKPETPVSKGFTAKPFRSSSPGSFSRITLPNLQPYRQLQSLECMPEPFENNSPGAVISSPKQLTSADLEFDVKNVPFSRRGSYLAVSVLKPKTVAKEGLYLRHLRGGGKGPVFLIEPVIDGEPVPYIVKATPSILRLEIRMSNHNGSRPSQDQNRGCHHVATENTGCSMNSKRVATPGQASFQGFAEFCFPTPYALHFKVQGAGLGLRFTMETGSYDHATLIHSGWEVNSYTHGVRFLLTPVEGKLEVDAPWKGLNCEYIQASFVPGRSDCPACRSVAGERKGKVDTSICLDRDKAETPVALDRDEAETLVVLDINNRETPVDSSGVSSPQNGRQNSVQGLIEEYVIMKEHSGKTADYQESVESVRDDFEQWLKHCPEPYDHETKYSMADLMQSAVELQESDLKETQHSPKTNQFNPETHQSMPEPNSKDWCRQQASQWEKPQSMPEPHSLDRSALLRGHTLAAYITWSCMVRPEGYLTRPAMYMSKNWMANIWSWDHCFNAMAQIYRNPALAWDQYCIFFDRQHPSGVLPDYMNNQHATWSCCKPPIHGWALGWMMERDATNYITKDRLSEVYISLVRWTDWWFKYRDDDGDSIPQYNHGNDSGWDNSTVFRQGVPVESPDLSAFLVIQMEVLANIASRLGRTGESTAWRARSQDLLERMIAHFWDGDRPAATLSGPSPLPAKPQEFHYKTDYKSSRCCPRCSLPTSAQCVDSHRRIECESLLPYVSIILGKRLPAKIRQHIVSVLSEPGKFLTKFGLATESISSPYYNSDGYWRGPIWAPSTMLIVEGLNQAGERALARDIALRFCQMASENGMAENFDALSGKALQDKAFTWTSSVYMILAHEYL